MKSLLFVPAKRKMLDKIKNFSADAYIIDLEDSIQASEKESALQELVLWLKENQDIHNLFIRLNANRYQMELQQLVSFENMGYMLPKFEDVNFYSAKESIWKKSSVIALLETPKGIANTDKIVQCDWINAISFGAEDYTATTNILNSNQYLSYQKSKIVNYAKAYGKKVFDTPSFELFDDSKFQQEVNDSKNLGFDGKMAINPKHLEYINQVFSENDIELMKKIISEYEKNEQAVFVYAGKVYEKMHIARMKRIIKEQEL